MTIVNLKYGDIVYGISSNQIKEYIVLGVSRDNRIRSKDLNSSYIRENSYGDNCYLSRNKAERVLNDKLILEKLNIKKISTIDLCGSCDAPIDNRGFCRCT